MSPNRNLISVFAQVNRKFSTRSRRNLSSSRSSKVSKGARFLIQSTGVTLGWVSGYVMYGGKIAKYEEMRQQIEVDVLWNHEEVEDLREKMWPEFRKMTLFRYMDKMWYESDARKKMKKWDDDLRKKMCDKKS